MSNQREQLLAAYDAATDGDRAVIVLFANQCAIENPRPRGARFVKITPNLFLATKGLVWQELVEQPALRLIQGGVKS